MFEVGRDLWRSSGPTSLLRQGHLELAAHGYVQNTFEYFWERLLHSISKNEYLKTSQSNLCQCSVTLTVQKHFLMLRATVFQFVAIASGPVTGHHWKDPGYVVFAPSLQVFIYINKISPWAFSLSGWTDSPHGRDAPVPSLYLWPFAGLSPVCPCLSYWGTQNWT